MLLIEKADVVFSSGLNVFTGETGAGKSIIFDCLGFVFGNKTRKSFLKEKQKSGQVTAEFEIDNSSDIVNLLLELSIPISETLIIRRVEFDDGRRKSYINDVNCTTDLLKKIGEQLIEFVDQKNFSKILKKQNHINLLDNFCSNKDKLCELNKLWSIIKCEEKKLSNLVKEQNKIFEELDFKKKSLSELKSLNLLSGEFEELEIKRKSLKSSSRIKEYLNEAYELITKHEINKALTNSISKLEKTSEIIVQNKLLEDSIQSFSTIISNLDEIEKNIKTILDDIFPNDIRLEDIEERLYEVKKLSRKHNVFPDDLIVLKEEIEKQLLGYSNFEEEIKLIQKSILSNEVKYDELANSISTIRKVNGKKLSKNINNELSHLKMDGIKFIVVFEKKKEKSIIGNDEVFFQLSNNNLVAQDLEKVASGGELSRILLALKVSLVQQTSGLALVFDEIDRGIGGATAEAVGNRLSILSRNEQILIVTHSPQVASKAQKHWNVSKKISGEGFPLSNIKELGKDDIKKELARMISGKIITKEAIAAAEKLMP